MASKMILNNAMIDARLRINATIMLIIVLLLHLSITDISLEQKLEPINSQDNINTNDSNTSDGKDIFATDTRGPSSTNTNKQIKEFRANEALESIRFWTLRFGRDIYYGNQESTCFRSIRDQFDPAKSDPARKGNYRASIVSNDWTRMHGEIVKTISNTMSWHKSAVEAIAKSAEYLAGNHTFEEKLQFDYVDVHRLQDLNEEEESNYQTDLDNQFTNNNNINESTNDPSSNNNAVQSTDLLENQPDANGQPITSGEQNPEFLGKPQALQSIHTGQPPPASSDLGTQSQGEWQTPIRFLKLNKHRNFGDIPINTDESAVHVPVHVFPGDPPIMNGIAWSEGLTKVFRDNFIRNPKLTNQYFASQLGFMRLFPAQKWQIAKNDPDLYDARMRSWYVAGASSRKDVVILVDSSGSMTGSRRDIAKGVVFEILDTLTENDHFLILKFSDIVQQVGVPECSKMRVERGGSNIPLKNTMVPSSFQERRENETDVESIYLLPANGRNVRYVKTNFTLATSGIANFSHALITAFEILRKYQDTKNLGSQCNQAIMLITDGSPSDFEDIFNRYNYPNAPVRVFTYLIGREAGDGSHTKMMACHNRGFYTHVINLAEVRETVQQYIPVMARPLVLNGTHPITWTPAYGELTYQFLTDWIWESRRREKARAILAASGRGSISNQNGYVPDIRVTNDEFASPESMSDESFSDSELEAIDLFGYNYNPDCFWQTAHNDLMTTVVQPVYDTKNESKVVEKYLNKNLWVKNETVMRTANLLGVAAADMKIKDIISLAPSHKLGANGYAIMLTNNGFVMHHPDLRPILEPFSSDPSEKNARILKPFFSSMDFTQVEHILNSVSDNNILSLRNDSVSGLTGWRELTTKRTLDCQRRVQSRKQSFYFKPLQLFPFSFMISIPQPYGSHRVEGQIEIKSASLPEKLTTYFTPNDYDLWRVHPDYQYCDGPSNNTITTLLDMLARIDNGKLDDIQWRPAESSKPPLYLPGKIICDKDLVQSLAYDAVATFGFSGETCGKSVPDHAESSLLGLFGVRFSFVATRSGLTRVRYYDDDIIIKKEALAFAEKHGRSIDETYYSRTVDYNMLVNDTATLIQVPFNAHQKIRDRLQRYEMDQALNYDGATSADTQPSTDGNLETPLDIGSTKLNLKDMTFNEKLEILANSSMHVIATQSIIVNEGTQRAVAGVTGVFYDYASFVFRLFNITNDPTLSGRPLTKPSFCYTGESNDELCEASKALKCGESNDTIDCLLVDNNGYIVVSEDLDFIGRHLRSYEPAIMSHLVNVGVFHEINITDYQSICMKQEEKTTTSSAAPSTFFRSLKAPEYLIGNVISNLMTSITYTWTVLTTLSSLCTQGLSAQPLPTVLSKQSQQQSMLSLIPNKTYLRPCERILTRYETRPGIFSSDAPSYYTTRCDCNSWFVYEQVPKTNLIMLIVDTTPACRQGCDQAARMMSEILDESLNAKYNIIGTSEEQVCSMFERESQLYRKKLDSCFSHHPEEEHIRLCGGACKTAEVCNILLITMLIISYKFLKDTF